MNTAAKAAVFFCQKKNYERSERLKFLKEGLGENFLQKVFPQWYLQQHGVRLGCGIRAAPWANTYGIHAVAQAELGSALY